MKPNAFLFRALPFLMAAGMSLAEELTGTVTKTEPGIVVVALTSTLVPSVNDKAEVVYKYPGKDGELLVATGRVAEINAESVRLTIDRAIGIVTKGHSVRIQSPVPQKRAVTSTAAAPVVPEGGSLVNMALESLGKKSKEANSKTATSTPLEESTLELPPGTSKPAEKIAVNLPVSESGPAKNTANGADPAFATAVKVTVSDNIRDTAKKIYEEGLALHKSGDREAAAAAYSRAIEADPTFPSAYYTRACISLVKKNYDGLISDSSAAIDLGHKSKAELYCLRGTGWAGKGNLDKALADHNTAITLDPNYALAYNNRGNDYYRKGDFARAKKDCDKSIELDPTSPLPWYNRGYIHFSQRSWASAASDWRQAIMLQPEYATELEPFIAKAENR